MATCSRCGIPVTFRYVDGRLVPLHLHGGCSDGGGHSTSNDFSGYSRSEESCCFGTDCPECDEKVFFIRHNGGSVWIDPPLGPPWYKHPCMDKGYSPTSGIRSRLLSSTSFLNISVGAESILGVVKESEVSFSCTITKIETERNDRYVLLIKNNAGYLTGKLVIFNPKQNSVSPCDNDKYIFKVVAIIEAPPSGGLQSEKVICPDCNAALNLNNLKKHLKDEHWFEHL